MPESGNIVDKGERIGYLPQHFSEEKRTVEAFFDDYSSGDLQKALKMVGLEEVDTANLFQA